MPLFFPGVDLSFLSWYPFFVSFRGNAKRKTATKGESPLNKQQPTSRQQRGTQPSFIHLQDRPQFSRKGKANSRTPGFPLIPPTWGRVTRAGPHTAPRAKEAALRAGALEPKRDAESPGLVSVFRAARARRAWLVWVFGVGHLPPPGGVARLIFGLVSPFLCGVARKRQAHVWMPSFFWSWSPVFCGFEREHPLF